MKKFLKKLAPVISIIFFGFALWFLDKQLQQYNLSEISQQLADIPNYYIAASLLLSFLSYLLLTVYDAMGVNYIDEELEAPKIMRAGYVGYAFSHNIGLALITGGSIRYRIYSSWGFSGLQVTKIVAFSALTLWIGFCSVAGLSLLFATPALPPNITLPFVSLRVVGAFLLVMVVGYVWASARVKSEISFKKWTFKFPNLKLSLQQVLIASVDWLLASSVLYVLLPEAGVNFFSFVGVFLLAQILGLFSQVPGGLGVFESVMLLYLSNFLPGSKVVGILVIYRIIYYILPLLGALVVLGYQEYKANHESVKKLGEKAISWVPRVVPQVMSFSVFIGGAILLFSGAVPSEVPRMQWLQHFVPLPVIEISHFLASIIGAALLILAGALRRRIDAAYHLTIGLLIVGILLSLLKGADYEEATALAVMLVAMIPCRDEFHRRAPLFSRQFSPQWFTMILMVLVSAVWLGIFSYQHIEYRQELWWQFFLLGDAPRYLRATVAALGFTVIIGFIKLLRPRKKEVIEPREQELQSAQKILQNSNHTLSNLILLGDKKLLFNDAHTSFIMYKEEGRSRVVLGDPVGPEDEAEEMIWKFYEQCSDDDKWPVFYQIGEKKLEYYLDLGLTLFKLGEEARIPLNNFSVDQAIDEDLRTNYRGLVSAGYSWELLPENPEERCYEELKPIFEADLSIRKRTGQGFSSGDFDEAYLSHFPIAVVKKEGEIRAFANILQSGDGYELATDLLRYHPDESAEIIDFILIETMLWGKRQGFQCFNLGMAPLSGMDEPDFTPKWNKMAHFVYSYGENLYGFKRVRDYKNKFQPEWEPKFLACPGGISLPRALSNLASVVSGGFSTLVNVK
ncbi:MAG TPA: bifunctional lysylphosphatidylglycerol flippase/synthetase MprF [Balneolaceae bacterium]|nr:bifunctional lysylphosphatidylglycerol flippase/synthetase MprF [Balneolaceae bacterium]